MRNSAKEGFADRYRVLVSDTVHFLRCMAVAKLNPARRAASRPAGRPPDSSTERPTARRAQLVTEGQLQKGCLVRLHDYRVTWIQNRACVPRVRRRFRGVVERTERASLPRRVIILLDVEVLSGPMERIGSPQNYPESLSTDKDKAKAGELAKAPAPAPPPAPPAAAAAKATSCGGYHDLAEDVVLGIARAMGALHPGREGGPARNAEPPQDVGEDVAALAEALQGDASAARSSDGRGGGDLDDASCATRAANIRDAAAGNVLSVKQQVEVRKLLSRVVDRHLAGAADEENPDQNDGPLPLSAFAALDALRHCCGGAKAGALEKLAQLARRVHHHDFLLRPSALGLLASLAVRCAPRREPGGERVIQRRFNVGVLEAPFGRNAWHALRSPRETIARPKMTGKRPS